MKKIFSLLLAGIMPLTFAMENARQPNNHNEIDCWQRQGLNLGDLDMSCRAVQEPDALIVIDYQDGLQKKEERIMSHQDYRRLCDTIDNANITAQEAVQLHQELRNIVDYFPYSAVIMNGLTQEIKARLHDGDLRVIMPGFSEQNYPQFFADKDHKKFANAFINFIQIPLADGKNINFIEKLNAVLAELKVFEQKVNALPKKEEPKEAAKVNNTATAASSDWFKPHILIPAGIALVAIIGLLLWKKIFSKQSVEDNQQKKPAKKKVRFDESKNKVHVLSSQ